ncbi:MAG: glycosyltransferase family 4 protein [Candidatus Omnitrophica bacterium]|nr:glycosyltransferase family 4 protein [Candidatus Omnitrophota bacterium]
MTPPPHPLHVALFNRAFYPEISATGQLLTELAEGLAQNYGCRVTVVAGIPQGTLEGPWAPSRKWGLVCMEQHGSIAVWRARGTRFQKRNLAGRICNYLTYFGSACIVGLQLPRPDVIIALTDPPIIGLAALLSGRRFGVPVLISYRDLFPEVARLISGFRNPLIEGILRQVNKILIRFSDGIIALSEDMKNRLVKEKKAPPDKVFIIPDWADTDVLAPGDKINPFSEKFGLADKFVIMHAGNLGASQGLEPLLEAAVGFSDTPDLVFVFVGEGIQKEPLKAKASRLGLSNVHFIPYQPKNTLRDTFAAADCFVVSLKPGISGYIVPSKIYSILAAGRPYVAMVDPDSDIARLTEKHGCGLLVKQSDPKDLAEKIRRLYMDRALCKKLGQAAFETSAIFAKEKGVAAYHRLCRAFASGTTGEI